MVKKLTSTLGDDNHFTLGAMGILTNIYTALG